MSGGFDFPPASDASTPIGSLTRRFDSLRQTFQTEREERARIGASGDRASYHSSMPTPPPTMPRPRRMARPARRNSTTTTATASPPITDRLRQVAHGTRQQLRRLRQEMHGEDADIGEELRERRDLLDRMSNHLDGILHRQPPRRRRESSGSVVSANNSGLSSSERADTETRLQRIDYSTSPAASLLPRRRSVKRRKLEHHRDEVVRPDPYGYYGQIESGTLKMEIVSCDGGQFHPRDHRAFNLETYRAENVLRKDESVYCTKSSRCNMMLRQKGEALFHLESLVIAAPKRGYTAPIQQGLVFVGMSADKLTSATSTYSINYSDTVSNESRTRSPTPQTQVRSDERLSLLEAVNDDQIWQASRSRYDLSEPPIILPPPRPTVRGADMEWRDWATRSGIDHATGRYHGRPLDEDRAREATPGTAFLDNCDWPPLQDPHSAISSLTRAPTPPQAFTVTAQMESSDEEGERTRRAREDREYSSGPYGLPPFLPPRSRELTTDSDTDGENVSEAAIVRRRFARLQQSLREGGNAPRPRPPLRRRSTPGEIGNDVGDGDDEVLEPNARFFMPENDVRITIRFNPPVAGKFILLKLFSPQLRDGPNIDIEYVAAHGFSGPRFFPNVEIK